MVSDAVRRPSLLGIRRVTSSIASFSSLFYDAMKCLVAVRPMMPFLFVPDVRRIRPNFLGDGDGRYRAPQRDRVTRRTDVAHGARTSHRRISEMPPQPRRPAVDRPAQGRIGKDILLRVYGNIDDHRILALAAGMTY
jgi:hypothetical protein